MQHITLTTGDVRWSPRSEVDDGLMCLLVDHLAAGLRGRASIPRMDDYAMHAATERNVLIATISRRLDDATRLRAGHDWMPVLSMIVVPADLGTEKVRRLLGRAWADAPTVAVLPPGPWCFVRLYQTAALVPPDDLAWTGDYERCLAWAWLESGTAQQTLRH